MTLHRVRGQSSACQTSLQGCNRSKATQILGSGDLAQAGTRPDYKAAAWLRQGYGRVPKMMPPGRLLAARSHRAPRTAASLLLTGAGMGSDHSTGSRSPHSRACRRALGGEGAPRPSGEASWGGRAKAPARLQLLLPGGERSQLFCELPASSSSGGKDGRCVR